MRLDHLLSKEHLAPSGVQARQIRTVRVLLAAHGWNIDIDADRIDRDSVRHFAWLERFWLRGPACCTLLGPEGPDAMPSGVVDETQDLHLSAYIAAGGGTARTLRTTQWTRAS